MYTTSPINTYKYAVPFTYYILARTTGAAIYVHAEHDHKHEASSRRHAFMYLHIVWFNA